MKAQATLTAHEAKKLIAKAVAHMPATQAALRNGKIFIKCGTTASAVAEELSAVPLCISGRITPQGTKTAHSKDKGMLHMLLDKGEVRQVDAHQEGFGVDMGRGDVAIIGANALDIHKRTAIMVAAPMGGSARVFPGLQANGVTIIVVVGWEKLIPCSIEEAVSAAGRESVDLSMGSGVGLIPLPGTAVTETDAIEMLAGVKATVIGAGGVFGAEGSTTFVMEGEPAEVKKAWELIQGVKGAAPSGIAESMVECHAKSPACSKYVEAAGVRVLFHRACVYRQPGLPDLVFSEAPSVV
ncbi:MAG: hypothetical protein HYX92_15800 [Chloroflexi bacterium]|nr:hypothetical protein [Chloroflexota bacterium]